MFAKSFGQALPEKIDADNKFQLVPEQLKKDHAAILASCNLYI